MMRNPGIDAFKGLLIMLVVLGHNVFFSEYFYLVPLNLYNFHVACFLLLPCLFIHGAAQQYAVSDLLARYLVPHFLFFSTTCLLYFLLFVPKEGPAINNWLPSVAMAAVLAEENSFDAACGLRLFWFLPALLTMVLLLGGVSRAPGKLRAILVALGILVHATIGLSPSLSWFPFSLPLVLFLFPLGLLAGWGWRILGRRAWFNLATIALFVICYQVAASLRSYMGLAGTPRLPAVNKPMPLLFHDAYLLAAFWGILSITRFIKPRLLVLCGRHSLVIFLTHTLIWQAMDLSGILPMLAARLTNPIMLVAISFTMTMAVALGIALTITKLPKLHAVLFPRTWEQWRGTLGLRAGT